jgi:hypothetical protein
MLSGMVSGIGFAIASLQGVIKTQVVSARVQVHCSPPDYPFFKDILRNFILYGRQGNSIIHLGLPAITF